MTQPKTILTAAQAIRPYLFSLLDSDTAQQIDGQLQDLLTQAESGQNVENQITELLRRPEPTQAWMRRYIKGENPEQITRSISGYSSLAGDSAIGYSGLDGEEAPRLAFQYICSHCGYLWYREDSEPIPQCPKDLIPLVLAQS